MTIESIFQMILAYKVWIVASIFIAPWLAWLLCVVIPGRGEEAFVLSANMFLALIGFIVWIGYLAYAVNLGGWAKVVQEADILLLAIPPYHIFASIWLSRKRMSLNEIPAYRTLEGLAIIASVFLVLSWFANKIRIIFFSFFPFHYVLWFLAVLLLIGYFGYQKIFK